MFTGPCTLSKYHFEWYRIAAPALPPAPPPLRCVKSENWQDRSVHGHRHADSIQGDIVEQELHVRHRIHRDARLALHQRTPGRDLNHSLQRCVGEIEGHRDRPCWPAGNRSDGKTRWIPRAVENPAYWRTVQGFVTYMEPYGPADERRDAGQGRLFKCSQPARVRRRVQRLAGQFAPMCAGPVQTRFFPVSIVTRRDQSA